MSAQHIFFMYGMCMSTRRIIITPRHVTFLNIVASTFSVINDDFKPYSHTAPQPTFRMAKLSKQIKCLG
jgi:hypothetical protein